MKKPDIAMFLSQIGGLSGIYSVSIKSRTDNRNDEKIGIREMSSRMWNIEAEYIIKCRRYRNNRGLNGTRCTVSSICDFQSDSKRRSIEPLVIK